MLKLNSVLAGLMMFCVTFTAFGQGEAPPKKDQYVLVPREVGLVTVAFQPNSPIQFENAQWYVGVEGGRFYTYDVRNKGNKAIRWIGIGDSTGNRWTWGVTPGEQPIKTGHLIPGWGKHPAIQIVSLTNELRQHLKLQGGMKGITVLMVIRVEFADGTVYDEEPIYRALLTYVENLQGKLDHHDQLIRETEQKQRPEK
ncbi:MAG TPA: hypothetical protein VJU84_01880 [Pyrinomonadaceae bacterium]|nr:hypothetical protein [Pyrinomonadaceae bacterium]